MSPETYLDPLLKDRKDRKTFGKLMNKQDNPFFWNLCKHSTNLQTLLSSSYLSLFQSIHGTVPVFSRSGPAVNVGSFSKATEIHAHGNQSSLQKSSMLLVKLELQNNETKLRENSTHYT